MDNWDSPQIGMLLGVGRRVRLDLGHDVNGNDIEDVDVISAVLAGPNGPQFIVLGTGEQTRGYFTHAIHAIGLPWDGQVPIEHPGLRTGR